MNRGRYDFASPEQEAYWKDFVAMTVDAMLHGPANQVILLTALDFSPCLLDKCLTACGWYRDETEYDRECSWSYYFNGDYPNKGICVFVNTDTLKFQMDCYNKEE